MAIVELFVVAHQLSLGRLPDPICWRARLCCFCVRIVEEWLRSMLVSQHVLPCRACRA